jgi:membrane associated rhomboid family serine protease
MGSYLVLFPSHRVLTFVFIYVVTLPAVVFLVVWFAFQFLLAGQNTNVAWEAHVFGFLFGAAVSLLFRSALRRRTSEFRLEDTADPFRTLGA